MLDGLRGWLLPSLDLFFDGSWFVRADSAKIAANEEPTEGVLVGKWKATGPPDNLTRDISR